MGALLLDGLGDGVFLRAGNCGNEQMKMQPLLVFFRPRVHVFPKRNTFLADCGRTLFDLQETAKIRSKTSHLKGLKIGIMGCIVNGPGKGCRLWLCWNRCWKNHSL